MAEPKRTSETPTWFIRTQPSKQNVVASQKASLLLAKYVRNQPPRVAPVRPPSPPWRISNPRPADDGDGNLQSMVLFDSLPPSAPINAWAGNAPLIYPADLKATLVAQFPDAKFREPEEFDDDIYMLPPLAAAQAIFAEQRWLKLTDRNLFYWPQVFDCDDFAYALKTAFSIAHFENASIRDPDAGLAAGILWCGDSTTGRHVLNFVVTSDQGVWVFDATPTSTAQCSAANLGLPVNHVLI